MQEKSEYKKIRKKFYSNYQVSGFIATLPLRLSFKLIRTSGEGDYDFSGTLRALGVLSLPATVILTPFALAAGGIGAIGNTLWGAVALPIAAVKGPGKGQETRENRLRSSTRRMQETMSPSLNDRELDVAIALSSQDANKVMPITSELSLPVYSKHTKKYIKSLEGGEVFAEKITALNKSLEAAGDKLTPEEKAQLKEFKDPITTRYMRIPVFLNDRFYDLGTLEKETKDPYTGDEFNSCEIQSGRILIDKFTQVIKKIKLNHLLLEKQLSEQNVLVM